MSARIGELGELKGRQEYNEGKIEELGKHLRSLSALVLEGDLSSETIARWISTAREYRFYIGDHERTARTIGEVATEQLWAISSEKGERSYAR